MCKVSSGKKNGGGTASALDFAKKDKGDLGKNLPELETYFMAQEKAVGLNKIDYERFVYLIKRYSYKGTPLLEHMFKEICPELNLDYE